MNIDQQNIVELGDELYEAWKKAQQINPITDRFPNITVEDAYRIQLRTIEKRKLYGNKVIGKKIGITAKPVMKLLGVDQPDFGHLMSDMEYENDKELKISNFCQPKGEGEIAFVLKKDLSGPGVTASEVLAATEHVLPAFEIVDSRIQDWKIKIQDTVADNASAGAFVLGEQTVDPHGIDLSACGIIIKKNNKIIGTGSGAATMDHPANAVAWLANKLGDLGFSLKSGEVILSGSLSLMFPIQSGDELSMEIDGLGQAKCYFG